MKTIILAVMFGLLAAVLIMGDLPQKIVNYGVTPSYAMGLNPGKTDPDRFKPKHKPTPNPSSVPEPSSLLLMGSGVAGVGIYLFIKKRNRKK